MRDRTSQVVEVVVVLSRGKAASEGLLAWAACRVGRLQLDGLSVRRTLDDRLIVTLPARRDRRGRRHPYVVLHDAALRGAIESAVLAEFFRTRARAGTGLR